MVKESKISQLSISGGSLPLDFVNTVSHWLPVKGTDYLTSYADLRLWTERIGLLTADDLRRYRSHCTAASFGEKFTLNKFRAAREVMYHVFSKIAGGKTPNKEKLLELNAWFITAHHHQRLIVKAGGVVKSYNDDKLEFLPLWYILDEAESLLLSPDQWNRIRACPACSWLFLDTSKGGKRRWCNMQVCGSREKALRYYHSKKVNH